MPKKQTMKYTNLDSIFKVIDSNLSKFYSSRPPIQYKNGSCSCKNAVAQKQEQVNFYSQQKQMINSAVQSLTQQDRDQGEKIIGKILYMAIQYINKILQFINRDYLCQCKKSQITQSLVMKHKIHFMRQQNDKFFKLFQQKNSQCQKLKKQIQELKNKLHFDVMPLSTKAKQTKQLNNDKYFTNKCGSFDFSESKSIKSSKISDYDLITKVQVKETTQKDHNIYFTREQIKKQKKSKIFTQSKSKQNSKYLKN